jgi:hypothetical protein
MLWIAAEESERGPEEEPQTEAQTQDDPQGQEEESQTASEDEADVMVHDFVLDVYALGQGVKELQMQAVALHQSYVT